MRCPSASALRVRTEEDARQLKALLEGWEIKSIFIYSRDEWCQPLGSIATGQAQPPGPDPEDPLARLLSALRCAFCRLADPWWQILHAYSAERQEWALIYPPWRVVVEVSGAGLGPYLRAGGVERFYGRVEVEVNPNFHEIVIAIPDGEG